MTPARLAFFREHISRASNVTPAQAAELLAALDAQAEEVERLRGAVAAMERVMWMAREYAESGGSGGPEMRDFSEMEQELEDLAALNPTQRNQETKP